MVEEIGTPEKEKERPGQAQEEPLAQAPDSTIFIQMADSLRLQGRYEEAIQTCREGLKKMPDSLPGRLLLGRCYLEKGRIPEAKVELERVARGIEACLSVYKWLSQVYLEEKDVDRALEVLRKTLYFETPESSSPKRVTPLEMGLLHRGPFPPFVPPRTPPAEPVREERKPTEEERGGKTPIPTDTLAEIYVKQGHFERALHTYREILAREPGNAAVKEKYEALKKRMATDLRTANKKQVQARLEKWLTVVAAKRTGPAR